MKHYCTPLNRGGTFFFLCVLRMCDIFAAGCGFVKKYDIIFQKDLVILLKRFSMSTVKYLTHIICHGVNFTSKHKYNTGSIE